jgi:hypothetical protein
VCLEDAPDPSLLWQFNAELYANTTQNLHRTNGGKAMPLENAR